MPRERSLIEYGFIAYNGTRFSNMMVDSYNRIQEHINTFIRAGVPVPEYLECGSHNLFQSYCENCK